MISINAMRIRSVDVSEQLVNSLELRLVHELGRGRIPLRVAEMSLFQSA